MPIPGRPELAMQYLWHAERIKNPPPAFDGCKIEPRELSTAEAKVEAAALDVLLRYFECRADFGDDPPKLSTDDAKRAEAVRKAEEESESLRREVAALKSKS